MITGILIICLALFSFTRSGENKYCVQVFAVLCALFQILSDNLGDSSGFIYYLFAAIIDLLIIIVISKPVKITETIIDLQNIALWFIYANTIGWVIYELYYPPLIYDSLCLALFISALVVAIRKGGGEDVGRITNIGNDFAVYSGYNSRNPQVQINKEKI
jgi:hypothetical protein